MIFMVLVSFLAVLAGSVCIGTLLGKMDRDYLWKSWEYWGVIALNLLGIIINTTWVMTHI